MGKTKKDGTKVDNGLKRLILRYCPNQNRLDYAQSLVEYASKELGKTITKNHLYLLVNDYVELNLGTMWVYDALETVLKQLQQVKNRAKEGQPHLETA